MTTEKKLQGGNMNLFLSILWDKRGGTLAITRVTANTLITAAATNNRATEIEAVVNGDIDATNIEDAAITAAKLGTAAVETSKIKDANVTTDKIADANVTTAKIADANVTAAKLASDAVETAKIKDANVTNAKIADDTIDLTAKVTGTLPVGNGGTGATAAANAANGVVVLNASSQLPAVSGALVTSLWKHSGATVFASAAAPTSFTDLDLSATVGANYALVMIKIAVGDAGAGADYSFRTNGESADVGFNANATYYGIGISGATIASNRIAYVILETDSGGIIEWKGLTNATTVLTLIGYI